MLIDRNPAATIEVTPSDMRRAAAAWDDASSQVAKANPADRVSEVTTAVPGGAASRQVSPLLDKLNGRFKLWCDGATQQGEALRKATTEYETADQQSADEAKRQQSVMGHGSGSGPSGVTVSQGPVVFDPSATSSGGFADLDERMSGREL